MSLQAPLSMETKHLPAPNSLRYLKGVGPRRALAFEKLGIRSARELLYFFPRRYEDRSRIRPIAEVMMGEHVAVRGSILTVRFKPLRHMPIIEILIGDTTGMIPVVWFNQPYLRNVFAVDQEIIVFGKADIYQNRLQIVSPEYEIVEDDESLHTGRITPIYPLTEGLFQKSVRMTIKELLDSQLEQEITDYLDEEFRSAHGLMELRQAIRQMHFPSDFEQLRAARRRIVFDEFFLFEITLLKKIEAMKSRYHAYPLPQPPSWQDEFVKNLPFVPTQAQRHAFDEIASDLAKETPMNRLLMGDVGSGKTVVAAYALWITARNKAQAAFLVPTEILAEQHNQTLQKILAPLSVTVGLLTSSTPAGRREKILAELKRGELDVLVGTHAILQEDVRFRCLALVVIDEQHKFGVYQRNRLLQRERRPHQLVMTATPIPRTLALTLYADLDVTALRELPKGRQPIRTYWITRKKQPEVLEHILEKIKAGEQAYFIFPLIEETEKTDLLAAKREYERLKKTVFSGIPMGLVHGRLSAEERDQVMKAFRRGEIAALVATSVVEVGVDNPNATVMVIENAERFGLSQLHQLRGRIGRGSRPSECFLFGEPKTEEGKKRLRILTKSQDGFLIAEEDLKLRGPGDFWGTRQSGEPLFKIGDPVSDHDLFMQTRQIALRVVKNREVDYSTLWENIQKHLALNPIQY